MRKREILATEEIKNVLKTLEELDEKTTIKMVYFPSGSWETNYFEWPWENKGCINDRYELPDATPKEAKNFVEDIYVSGKTRLESHNVLENVSGNMHEISIDWSGVPKLIGGRVHQKLKMNFLNIVKKEYNITKIQKLKRENLELEGKLNIPHKNRIRLPNPQKLINFCY